MVGFGGSQEAERCAGGGSFRRIPQRDRLGRYDYVNDPRIIAQNDNVISINATIQIDLTGACNSEHMLGDQYSGHSRAESSIGLSFVMACRSSFAYFRLACRRPARLASANSPTRGAGQTLLSPVAREIADEDE